MQYSQRKQIFLDTNCFYTQCMYNKYVSHTSNMERDSASQQYFYYVPFYNNTSLQSRPSLWSLNKKSADFNPNRLAYSLHEQNNGTLYLPLPASGSVDFSLIQYPYPKGHVRAAPIPVHLSNEHLVNALKQY